MHAMVESLLGGKKAEAEAEVADREQPLFTEDSPGTTTGKTGKTAVAAKSAGGHQQATPSVLQAATSVFKPVTQSDYRSFGGGGARLKAEAVLAAAAVEWLQAFCATLVAHSLR